MTQHILGLSCSFEIMKRGCFAGLEQPSQDLHTIIGSHLAGRVPGCGFAGLQGFCPSRLMRHHSCWMGVCLHVTRTRGGARKIYIPRNLFSNHMLQIWEAIFILTSNSLSHGFLTM